LPDHQKTEALRSNRSGYSEETQGKVLPFRLTKPLRRKRQEAEARWLYRITGGFIFPDPPGLEAIEMFLEGWELP